MPENHLTPKLKLFVSYSRRDVAFVDDLVAGLELAGFEPQLDRQDIAAGEDWEARLGHLILGADSLIFVASPESVNSKQCMWEINEALALGKRIFPIIYKECDAPPSLRRLQFISFDGSSGINRSLKILAEALKQDVDWVREHSRLGEQAARWERRGEAEALLLRGDELSSVAALLLTHQTSSPEITWLQRKFVKASDAAEAARAEERKWLTNLEEERKKPAEIASYLPGLRRFARASMGDQGKGDAQVIRVLERFLADPAALQSKLRTRAFLYRALLDEQRKFGPTATPDHHKALLLLAVEGFSDIEVSHILAMDELRLRELFNQVYFEIDNQAPRTVLLIEDEPLVALNLEHILRDMGHRVMEIARTHSDARRAIGRKNIPDLIISDIQLADGSSGYDAVNEILTIVHVPVVFITAYPDRLLTGIRPEPAFLLTKPYRADAAQAMFFLALCLGTN